MQTSSADLIKVGVAVWEMEHMNWCCFQLCVYFRLLLQNCSGKAAQVTAPFLLSFSKAVPLHAMEALGWTGRTAPTHSRPRHYMGGEWSASRPGRALPPGKGASVPIEQEAGWAPEPVWTQRLEEKSFAPAEDRTPIARSSSP
jgi:hypothetical protein